MEMSKNATQKAFEWHNTKEYSLETIYLTLSAWIYGHDLDPQFCMALLIPVQGITRHS